MSNINKIIELNNLAKGQSLSYIKKRFLFEKISKEKTKRFIGLLGARGVGKSVIFKQLAALDKNSVYISVDTAEIEDLFELVKTLNAHFRYDTFYLDEIHFYPEYDKALKLIYDFLDVKIFFTSSVSLSLYESAFDLARRTKLYFLFPFGYREYLFFISNLKLKKLTLAQIKDKKYSSEHLRSGYLFEEFLKGKTMPFALEEPDILDTAKNILEKIIYRDIPSVTKLGLDELNKIKKMFEFIGKSQIDGISYSTLSNNLKITKYKAEQYVKLLEKAFLLNVIMPKGTNVLKEPKIVMNLPYRLLYKDFDEAIGGLREDFFVEVLKMAGKEFFYLKNKKGKKTPDYLVKDGQNEYIVEVGGKGKGISQFKGINKEKAIIFSDSEITEGIKRPLFLAGFLV